MEMERKPITEIGQRYPHAMDMYETAWQRIPVIKEILRQNKDLPKDIRTELSRINLHATRYAQLANRKEARILRSLAATARGILSRVGGVRGRQGRAANIMPKHHIPVLASSGSVTACGESTRSWRGEGGVEPGGGIDLTKQDDDD